MQKKARSAFVTVSAIVLAVCGIAAVFAPGELSAELFDRSASSLPVALWGSAMMGFAAMNWMARHSILGGIYGRAVVVANQTHFFIGSMILLGVFFDSGLSTPATVLLCVYVLNAILFSYLMFRASGLEQ